MLDRISVITIMPGVQLDWYAIEINNNPVITIYEKDYLFGNITWARQFYYYEHRFNYNTHWTLADIGIIPTNLNLRDLNSSSHSTFIANYPKIIMVPSQTIYVAVDQIESMIRNEHSILMQHIFSSNNGYLYPTINKLFK